MADLYKLEEPKLKERSQQLEKVLLEACDADTRAVLRLADLNIMPCGRFAEPTLTAACKSREIAEAIGVKHVYIKQILKQITGCEVILAIHYKIADGVVYYDTEGDVAPAKWYLCNRKEFGKDKIPLPSS